MIRETGLDILEVERRNRAGGEVTGVYMIDLKARTPRIPSTQELETRPMA